MKIQTAKDVEMKKELSLPEIKPIVFEILCHFKRFCLENNIKFFLSNGTLLGAVKYGGFIPWDDDIDVFVPRDDYNKLIEIYKNSEKYKLFSSERNEDFRFTFAKLCDMTTVKEEINVDNGVTLGLDIDIFPLDCCTEHILKKSVSTRIKINLVGCMLSKMESAKGKGFLKGVIIRYCRMRGYDHFSKKLKKIIEKEGKRGNTHKGCLMWQIYGNREVIPAHVFDETVTVNFEGEEFPAPKGYDTYLRSLYGEYEKDPPKEKQKTHHNYKGYRIQSV